MVAVEIGWLNVLRRYLVAIAVGNLIWEFAHMPLYTLWETGSWGEIVFAAIHCTGGDILIAMSALLAALFLFGSGQWPETGYRIVGIATTLIGIGYTVFSEWLNIEVREAWAYRDLMPVIPVIDAGLSPIAQWIVLPIIAFWWVAPRKRSTMSRLASVTIFMFAAAVLFVVSPLVGHAQSDAPLADLLRSTHIHGLAIDRANSDRLLIATHHGLYALRLESGTVDLISEQRDDFMGFTPHPTDAQTLYASGHPARGGNLGFIASNDGGRTWTMLSPGVGGPVDFHQMDVSKADSSMIYGVHGGLQISRDGGRNWSRVGPAPDGLIDLAASSTDVARVYAATQQGLFVSADSGRVWQPAHLLRRPASMIEVTTDGSVYAFLLGSGLLRTEEPSLNWQILSNDFGDRYLLHLAVDPEDPARLYASTHQNELLTSEDGGRTWQRLGAQ
jgi:hypothetical protein